ncbi:hypothetical protein B9Z55_013124 [Caenorhabditis nigoni]|uniref:Solute carrier family 25 member 51 n=1 Tax=Caenorhabditis nigoni TaxID=1611254 RepID=A0A2G5U185_9PELO|nr:hypothetical protein B9Z55_013124 [Caenorhabditis nigoni]
MSMLSLFLIIGQLFARNLDCCSNKVYRDTYFRLNRERKKASFPSRESLAPAPQIPTRNHLDFIAGWGAGCIETCILYPSNKIIFRQQLHGFHVKDAIQQIKLEGVGKLYRGLLPPLIMRTTSRALMYGLYDEFQISLKCPHAPPNSSFSICHAQAAFLSGVCEAMLCPLERVQVLLQTTKFHDKFKNTLHAFSRLKEYGYREYYRGFSVILVRNSLSNTLFFTLRDPLKQRIMDLPQASRLPCSLQHWIGDFIAGSLLGATISTAFFPLGVVKNHMQAKVGVNYDSGLRVFRDVWQLRNRSLRNLYLGVHLNFTRSLVAWGIINSMYGILRRALAPFE